METIFQCSSCTFQTLQHDLLQLKLSELVFNSHFESEVLYDNTSRRESISIPRIVEEYFLYVPKMPESGTGRGGAWHQHRPRDSSEVLDGSMGSSEEKGRRDQQWTREDRVEEMVYLLLMMLNSYLKCSSGELTSSTHFVYHYWTGLSFSLRDLVTSYFFNLFQTTIFQY